jgi:hypothetical protein
LKSDAKTDGEKIVQPVFNAHKEVEQNPFKKLIDITDLMDFEINPIA